MMPFTKFVTIYGNCYIYCVWDAGVEVYAEKIYNKIIVYKKYQNCIKLLHIKF